MVFCYFVFCYWCWSLFSVILALGHKCSERIFQKLDYRNTENFIVMYGRNSAFDDERQRANSFSSTDLISYSVYMDASLEVCKQLNKTPVSTVLTGTSKQQYHTECTYCIANKLVTNW